jgi:hypothetical protein
LASLTTRRRSLLRRATNVASSSPVADVRARSLKRVTGTLGEGSMAVSVVHQYLCRDERSRCAIDSECRGQSGHS